MAAASLAVVLAVTAAAVADDLGFGVGDRLLVVGHLGGDRRQGPFELRHLELSAEVALHRRDRLLVGGGPRLAVGRVPQLDQVVGPGRGQLRAVAAHGQRRHRGAVLDLANLLIVGQVPLADRAVGAGRDELRLVGRRSRPAP